MLANTSLVFAPSSGGARYSFTGAREGDGLADQRQIKLEGMIELDLFAAVAAASSASVFLTAPTPAYVGFGAYATAPRASVYEKWELMGGIRNLQLR